MPSLEVRNMTGKLALALGVLPVCGYGAMQAFC
jgi:hypothetical protein